MQSLFFYKLLFLQNMPFFQTCCGGVSLAAVFAGDKHFFPGIYGIPEIFINILVANVPLK